MRDRIIARFGFPSVIVLDEPIGMSGISNLASFDDPAIAPVIHGNPMWD